MKWHYCQDFIGLYCFFSVCGVWFSRIRRLRNGVLFCWQYITSLVEINHIWILKVTVSCTRASEKKKMPPSIGDSFRLSLSIYEKLHFRRSVISSCTNYQQHSTQYIRNTSKISKGMIRSSISRYCCLLLHSWHVVIYTRICTIIMCNV